MVQTRYYRPQILCLILVLTLAGLLGCTDGEDQSTDTGTPPGTAPAADTTPPPTPVLNLTQIRSPVNADRLVITGQVEANSLVTITQRV